MKRLFVCLLLISNLSPTSAKDKNEPSAYANSTVSTSLQSIKDWGVSPDNTPETNSQNLQKAIDAMSAKGGALFVEPTETGYPLATGIRLRRNVSLIGVHGPTGRGTASPDRKHPVGSLFVVTDTIRPLFIVESATQLRGLQFYYPEQTHNDPTKVIPYKPTIQMADDQSVQGVTLSQLTFYGEYISMDFCPRKGFACEQILFEHCYGYPLSGRFIAIDKCYDIPRILHCHVNPANMREFGRSFNRSIIDYVVSQKTYTYWIDHTDNAQLMDLFTFGVYGGIYLGDETYGQLTNFNLDCVTVGLHKKGSQSRNRNWQIAQGSIIANTGERIEDVHPIIIEGQGHTSLSNVEAFSGDNAALTNLGASYDFMTVRGDKPLTVSAFGCRMQGYKNEKPINVQNPEAKIILTGCMDKDGHLIVAE